MLSEAIEPFQKCGRFNRLLVLSAVLWCLPHSANAETREKRYSRLLTDAQAAVHAQNWQGAAKIANRAGALLNSPQAYLLLLRYLSKMTGFDAGRCQQIKGATNRYFNACLSCEREKSKSKTYKKACASCTAYQTFLTRTKRLAVRSMTLIEELEAYSSGFEAGTPSKVAYSELTRSVRSCLKRPDIKTVPDGASIELNGKIIGQTPAQIDTFVGDMVVLELAGYTPVALPIKVTSPAEFRWPIKLEPNPQVKDSAAGQKNEAGATQRQPEHESHTLEWTLLGVGSASLITSGVFLFDAIAKRDDAEAINGESGQRSDFDSLKDQSQTSLTFAGVTGGIGAVALSLGLWLLLDDDGDNKTNAAQLLVSPDGMYLYGRF